MSQANYGSTAAMIDKINDIPTLQRLLHDPQYAGFTAVIIAKMSEINRLKQGAQAQQPQPPSVAQQAVQGQAPQAQPPQGMASGGIVAFRHGGKVKKYAEGGDVDAESYMDSYGRPVPKGTPDAIRVPNNNPTAQRISEARNEPVSLQIWHGISPPKKTAPVKPVTPATAQLQQPPSPPPVVPGVTHPMERGEGTMAFDSAGLGGGSSSRVSSADLEDARARIAQNKALLAEGDSAGTNAEEDRARIKEGIAQNPHMAMISAGLNMAHDASVNPHSGFMGNVAAGGIGGLDYYTKQSDQAANQLRDQNKIMRQEEQAKNLAAVKMYHDDVAAARQSDATKAYASALGKPAYMSEMSIRARAADLHQQDLARQRLDPSVPVGTAQDYIVKARQEYNSLSAGVQSAGIRSDATSQNARMTAYGNYVKNDMSGHPMPFELWSNQFDASGSAAPTVVRD